MEEAFESVGPKLLVMQDKMELKKEIAKVKRKIEGMENKDGTQVLKDILTALESDRVCQHIVNFLKKMQRKYQHLRVKRS